MEANETLATTVGTESLTQVAASPICLFEITVNRKEIEVELNPARRFKLTYNTAAFTPKREKAWKNLPEEERMSTSTLARFLGELILGWEIKVPPTDWPKDQVPTAEDMATWTCYPIDQENLEALPSDFLALCINAIVEDIRPNPESSAS